MSQILNDALLAYTAQMPCREIIKDGEVYLRRYFVRKNDDGSQVWLHQILKEDSDPRLHNHSWDAYAVVISGWYSEEMPGHNNVPYRKIRSNSDTKRSINTNHFHRISAVSEFCWSELEVFSGRAEYWGFLNPDGTTEKIPSAGEDWYLTCGPRPQ